MPVACVALLCAAAYLLWKRAEGRRAAADFAACRVKAEQGDAKSQYELGRMYFYGRGVPKDLTAWAEWCRKAADQKYVRAETQLGNTYYYGRGVDRDFDEALRWYHKAADQGESGAEVDIGDAYYHGNGVTQDHAQAAQWYRLAAGVGDARGEAELGDMYLHGFGVQQNTAEARLWFRKAADQGNSYAQEVLGLKERHLGSTSEITLTAVLIASLMFLSGWLNSGEYGKSSPQRFGPLAGTLGLSYVAADIYTHSSLAVFRSAVWLDLLVVARGVIAGLFALAIVILIWPRRQWGGTAWFLLAIAGALFVIINGTVVWLGFYRPVPIDTAENLVRHLCSLDAQVLTWSVAALIILRKERGKTYDDEPVEREELGS